MADYMNVPYLSRRYGEKEPKRLGLAHPSIAPYGVFRTSDGEILVAIQNDREWGIFCARVLKDQALASDARFSRNTSRVTNRDMLDGLIQKVLAAFSLQQLCTLLDEVKIAYGRISTMADLIDHHSAVMTQVETAQGTVEVLAPPVIVDGMRPVLGRVPELGEHSASLRREYGAPAKAFGGTSA
jgi:crotonobetainyl-CoA:carnitine CoA-transferase CaiB-like acyl-CoA transferase